MCAFFINIVIQYLLIGVMFVGVWNLIFIKETHMRIQTISDFTIGVLFWLPILPFAIYDAFHYFSEKFK